MKKVSENLSNQNGHYLYPFFWQHGESNEKIEEYMDKMLEQGIYNVCIESRPHPDFLGPGWWQSMDGIIAKAKKQGMKIWILDDAKFPTGYANGQVPKSLQKKYLNIRRFDVVGPNRYGQLDLRTLVDMREYSKDPRHKDDEFFKAFIARNDPSAKDAFFEASLTDITSCYIDGYLNFELACDNYSIFVIYKTTCGQEAATSDYLDPTLKEATDVLINEVYEKHYDRYRSEFGKTIVGFFSDEPRFGNIKGPDSIIGKTLMPLPYNDLVERKLAERCGNNSDYLVFLFYGQSELASSTRFSYMDVVSNLYQENFSKHIGAWCQNHGVEYVGHVIEDNNAHARLGYGPGHYFRAMAGQDMAGIDIIGGQVVPGMDYFHEAFSTGGSDGEFYHYGLANMGASCAKLDPRKKGRLMCEAYGAYGWIEGLKMMKWISDHMISHGVNVIVPHAFSPKEFPDWDCPPHFYAHGKNPQYPYFHHLTGYLDRLCHLFSDGYKCAQVGVLYHGFGEWSGEAMLMQKVLKELQQNQISADVISEDYLLEAQMQSGSYRINNYDYDVLVVPYSSRLPQFLLDKIKELANLVPVYFVDSYPEEFVCDKTQLIGLEDLANELDKYQDLKTINLEPSLVCYKYQQADGISYFLTNESVTKTIATTVSIEGNARLSCYDPMTNEVYHLQTEFSSRGVEFELTLEPYQSLVLVEMESDRIRLEKGQLIKAVSEAEISLKGFGQDEYEHIDCNSFSDYLGRRYPDFSGSIKYEFELELSQPEAILELEEAYETITIMVNGKEVATSIAPPYRFDLSGYLKSEKNTIAIVATNTIYRNQRDSFSAYYACEPLGIVGPVKIFERM
ncbi:MAG: hypothetical protein PHI41_04535 [Erysipelotrichaceae bacterium]|nr:hypothetical protein [Erysipelotrichaceae bacterium]MDD3809199.1 hypothetical protein [Erysipelotrichaceae bacterium]